MRKKENLIQGSPEWLQFRLTHNGASEAAAMLGISKLSTRTELLKIKATGMPKEFSDYVQRFVLDKGHEVEALARPNVEKIIGDDLYPVTYSIGNLSASCDGLTAMGDIAFEHKQWNKELAEAVSRGELPEEHWPQCQQVLYVTGAERLIFVTSDGTEENLALTWVYPDQEKQQQIINGWNQFDKDVAEYEHVEHQEKPQAEPMESFLVPVVQVKGELAIISNLDLFGRQLRSFVGNMTKDPQDDQDFANLESAVKKLKEAEDALEKAEGYALAQFADVNTMRQTVSELKELARSHRLTSEKLVKSQKELIKMRIFNSGKERFAEHVKGLQKEIIGVTLQIQQPDFAGAMKNKRTIASLHDSIDTCLANAKIEADSIAKDIRWKIVYFDEINDPDNYRFLFNDLQSIIYKSFEDFKLTVETRIQQHKQAEAAKLEAERKRIQVESEAKAKAEQERKLEAERAKIRAEEAEKARTKAEEERAAEEKRIAAINKKLAEQESERLAKFKDEQEILREEAKKTPVINKEPAETVTITREEYEQLLSDSELLNALRSAGVDNWDGYSIAMSMIQDAA